MLALLLAPAAPGHTLIASDTLDGANPWSWCAVNRGNEVDFYHYTVEGDRRGVRPFETFHPPEQADEVVYSGDRLGVRTGQILRFYDTANAFRHLSQFDFQLPQGTNEVIMLRDRLGVRVGQTLRFYDLSRNFLALSDYDFTVPEGTQELVITQGQQGAFLGVRIGPNLQFYNIEQGYSANPNHRCTLPPGTDEIAVTGSFLLTMQGNEVTAHRFQQHSMSKPVLVMQLAQPQAPPLESLRGKAFVQVTGSNEVHVFDFWAKGNRVRTEETRGGSTTVTVQHDDTLYSFQKGASTGTRGSLGDGILGMGLINQIAEIKEFGQRGESREINGVQHDQYIYRKTPEEVMVGWISTNGSLPGIWELGELEDDGRVTYRTATFKDLEPNVMIPDAVFGLPPDLVIEN